MITAHQFYVYEDQLTEEELSVVYGLIDAADSETQAMKYICWLFLGGSLEPGFRTKAMDAVVTVGRRRLEERAVESVDDDAPPRKGSFYRVSNE